jgi:NADPH-dependent 2,4-dienoyl-CoA reductase/sulfur reductase-like enzyme
MTDLNQVRNKNIIVVGGNAAGPAAAAKAKRSDPSANVILFEASEFISTGTCEMPYVLSGEIQDYKKIIFYDKERFKSEKGVTVYTKHFVESVDRKNKMISVLNKNDSNHYRFPYDKLILTTGSLAKKLPELNKYYSNVFVLKNVENLISIQKFLNANKPKRVIIIGSGYIGLEVAEALHSLGLKVYLIEKNNLPLPDSEFEIQKLINENIEKNGIDFIGGYKNLVVKDGQVIESINVDGRIIEADFIVQAIGFEPNNLLAVAANLSLGRFTGINVDQKLKTTDSNIFAAGDNIEVINKITNQKEYIPLATIAHELGHIAGANAAGANISYSPVVKNIALKIFDNTYSQVGLTSDNAKKHNFRFAEVNAVASNLIKIMPKSKKVFGKIIYEIGSHKILGASFFGGNEVIGYSDLISSAISANFTAEKLATVNYNYTPHRSPFINLLSILGRKISEK